MDKYRITKIKLINKKIRGILKDGSTFELLPEFLREWEKENEVKQDEEIPNNIC